MNDEELKRLNKSLYWTVGAGGIIRTMVFWLVVGGLIAYAATGGWW